ncbi:hypothetical protein ACVRW4_04805 [Streptococcus phocae subsp. phocae]
MTTQAKHDMQLTETILKELTPENQSYFERIQEDMLLAALLRDEKSIRRQLYDMAVDLRAAQADGQTAQDFFGRHPQEMARDIVANSPFISIRDLLRLVGLIGLCAYGCQVLLTFSETGVLTMNALKFLLLTGFNFIAIILIFRLLKRYRYQESKLKWGLGVIYLLINIILVYLSRSKLPGLSFLEFTVPSPWDLLSVFTILVILIVSKWQHRYFRPFSLPLLMFFVVACIRKASQSGLISGEQWIVWLPMSMMVLGVLGFYGWSLWLFHKD